MSTCDHNLEQRLETQDDYRSYQQPHVNFFHNCSLSYAPEDVAAESWVSWSLNLSNASPQNQKVESSLDGAFQSLQTSDTPLAATFSSSAFATPPRKVKRKGKRVYPSRYSAQVPPINSATSDESAGSPGNQKSYHCTSCPKSFKTTYGWKRHEAGVHGFHVQEWVCMLDEILLNGQLCVFCGDEATNMSHFEK